MSPEVVDVFATEKFAAAVGAQVAVRVSVEQLTGLETVLLLESVHPEKESPAGGVRVSPLRSTVVPGEQAR